MTEKQRCIYDYISNQFVLDAVHCEMIGEDKVKIGWAATKYLKADGAEEKPETITHKQDKTQRLFVGKVSVTSADVRTWAGSNYPTIKKWPKLNKGNLVDVMNFTQKAEDGSSWYYVRIANKYYGFVASKDIKKQ